MKKPNDYDEVQVGGEFTPVELGGHKMVIKGVREEKSKNGKDMIVVAFDFDQSDVQPNYFSNLFEKDIRPEKKWPNNGTQYILTLDSEGKTNKNFKSFITACEHSNNFETSWGKDFCSQFKGKKIGGVFGEVEEYYNGEVKNRHRLRWFCEYDRAVGSKIPEPKLYNGSGNSSASSGFINTPANTDEEIPF